MARTFRRKRESHPIAELNVTNLIDLGFTLLIIFMIASTVIQQEQSTPIDLPTTSKSNQKPDPSTKYETVSIKKDGSMLLGDQPITMTQLSREFSRMADQDTQPVVQIRADENANWGTVFKIMDEAGKHGLRRVAPSSKFN